MGGDLLCWGAKTKSGQGSGGRAVPQLTEPTTAGTPNAKEPPHPAPGWDLGDAESDAAKCPTTELSRARKMTVCDGFCRTGDACKNNRRIPQAGALLEARIPQAGALEEARIPSIPGTVAIYRCHILYPHACLVRGLLSRCSPFVLRLFLAPPT